MRIILTIASVAAVLAALAAPAQADPTEVRGRVTVTGTDRPIEDATVYLTGGAGTEAIVRTDVHGRYRTEVKGSGTYAMVVAFNGVKQHRRITVEPGVAVTADAQLALESGEVIVLVDRMPRKPPVPKQRFSRRTLPYSDAAIEHDAWAVAWLLLDIDARGAVTRVKFLHRPGYELEPIALREAFKLRFQAARNYRNEPVRSLMLWAFEWQSYWWLVHRTGVTSGYASSSGVPCRGSGRPWDFDSGYPTYRDCSPPDFSKMKTESWIDAPATAR